MTVIEHMNFYAKIKSISGKLRGSLVKEMMAMMNLEEYRDVRVETLSGGNKRKLSISIALLGNPSIILLDEPSAGVDV